MADILTWIDFGPVASERDDNLSKYFYDAGVSEAVIQNNRQFLLLGRKGAGKTAVFRHMQSKPRNWFRATDLIVALSTANYNWQAHALLENRQKSGGFEHRDSWRLVIAIEVVRVLVEACGKDQVDVPGSLKLANKVLTKIFSQPVPTWSELLKGKLFKISKLKLPGGSGSMSEEEIAVTAGEVSFEDVQKDGSLREALTTNLEYLTRFLEICIRKSESKYRVFVIFDKLDESWVNESFESCKKIISGLVHAADFALSEFRGSVRPIVFLREDIFQTLDINDRNKLKEDCSSTLMWDVDSLEKMLLERVNFYALQGVQPRVKELAALFDRREMRSRTTPVRYLFNRTFCRPRDLVAYGNKVISAMKEERAGGSPGSERDQLSAEAIYLAEAAYSDYLYQELDDEWRTQRPQFAEYLSAFENIGYSIFSSGDLEQELGRKINGIDRAGFRDVTRFLFDISALGFRVGQSSIWRFKCFYPTQGFQDADTFKVHPGLIKRLGLKEAQAAHDTELDGGSEDLFPGGASKPV